MLTVDGIKVGLSKPIGFKVGIKVSINIADGGHWYGHGFNHNQPYPLEAGEIDNATFAVHGFSKVHKALESYILDAAKDFSIPLIEPMWFLGSDMKSYIQFMISFLLAQIL